MELLRTIDLECARGGAAVLSGVNLALLAGHALILRGSNGSGKTTLLRTLAGLQPPLGGRIQVADDAIAYGAHADALKPTLSVRENLQFWASIYRRENIAQAMERFNLVELADRAAGTLSAGQKRRLGLARLLVSDRPIWVLDEPTVSLDKASVDLFASVVAEHLEAGGGAIIATHIGLGLNEEEVVNVEEYRSKQTVSTAFGDDW